MNNLEFLRRTQGLSQAVLAQRAGVCQNEVSRMERICNRPAAEKISAYFNKSIEFLMAPIDASK